MLHDWRDGECRAILQHLRDAMAPDSVIAIGEIIIPKVGATLKQMNYDLMMMSCIAATERTLKQWKELLAAVGLKIRDVWIYDDGLGTGLIIAIPA